MSQIPPADLSDADLKIFCRSLDDDGGGISIVELGQFVEQGVDMYGRDRLLSAEEEGEEGDALKPKRGQWLWLWLWK